MLCDICNKTMATVHLTEIINDKVVEIHICQNCTKAKSGELKGPLSIPQLLSGMVDASQLYKKEEISIKCQFCGLTYADFRKKARLGCGKCYSAFKVQLIPMLKKIHGCTHYAGKNPLESNSKFSLDVELKRIKDRLQRAVELEEYEEAARLRDELKKIGQKSIQ